MESRTARVFIKLGTVVGMLFLYVPLGIVLLYSFNASIGQKWPIEQFTTRFWTEAWKSTLVHEALVNSLIIASVATVLALLLGSLAAFAVHRFQFFGRNAVSLLLVLPIALPGIVTAIALAASLDAVGATFGLFTIMLGHATFCVVVVYNNVIARLRRTQGSIVEASMDLGANGWQTFRLVTFPAISTAVIAGALLSFALSFDEIIVTNFLSGTEITIPKFIYNNLRQPRNRPIVNVVAVGVTIVMLIPVYIAQRLAGGGEGITRGGAGTEAAEP